MTLEGIDITVDERRKVTVRAPEHLRALAALLESDLRIEGPQLYKALTRLYAHDDTLWKATGNSCTLKIQGDSVRIDNNITEDRSEMSRDDLLQVLERLRDEMAFARARSRSGE